MVEQTTRAPLMTKQEMREGLLAGRRLIQEEWADHDEIVAVNELIDEGIAVATPWEWHGNFQCERRIITRAPQGTPASGETQ